MNGIDLWPIIKWILIVLVAAFIGQFGKTLANYLLNRIKAGKTVDPSKKTGEPPPPEKHPDLIWSESTADKTGYDAKAEKKALKALAKIRKKEKD